MQNRIRWGIWGLPLSGLLSTIAALVPGVGIDPAVDPEGFARASSNIGLGNMLAIPSAVFLLFLGAIMFGTAIWRSKTLPKLPGLLLAIGIILPADPLFYYQPIIWVAGGALLLFSGVWISRRVSRTTTDCL